MAKEKNQETEQGANQSTLTAGNASERIERRSSKRSGKSSGSGGAGGSQLMTVIFLALLVTVFVGGGYFWSRLNELIADTAEMRSSVSEQKVVLERTEDQLDVLNSAFEIRIDELESLSAKAKQDLDRINQWREKAGESLQMSSEQIIPIVNRIKEVTEESRKKTNQRLAKIEQSLKRQQELASKLVEREQNSGKNVSGAITTLQSNLQTLQNAQKDLADAASELGGSQKELAIQIAKFDEWVQSINAWRLSVNKRLPR